MIIRFLDGIKCEKPIEGKLVFPEEEGGPEHRTCWTPTEAATPRPASHGPLHAALRRAHHPRQPRGSARWRGAIRARARGADGGWDTPRGGGFSGCVHWSCSTEESPKGKLISADNDPPQWLSNWSQKNPEC